MPACRGHGSPRPYKVFSFILRALLCGLCGSVACFEPKKFLVAVTAVRYNRLQLEMKFGFTLGLFLAILCVVNGASAASYAWPLPQNYGVSATFGESRSDHFHAGIDLSTNGETGIPVLAIEAGEVYRLKVQKRGYGRAVYIKHANGMVSVYGHLERYSEDLGLERMYREKVAETGNKYVGDIFIEPPIRVEKGTVVAFSGESGAGLPHLHLELRRDESVPVNPLTNGLLDNLDPVPPAFQAAYLYPAGGSVIDGTLDTQVLRFSRDDSGLYTADHVPVVRGDFQISVSAYDAALRPYHRNPHKITYSIDNQPMYEVSFNEFSYLEPEHFGLLYDLGKPGPSYYEYPIFLSNNAGVQIPFSRNQALVSIGTLAPGPHRLSIIATDANANASTAFLDFVVNRPPSLKIEKLESDGTDLLVRMAIEDPDWKGASPSQFAGEAEFSLDKGKTFVPFTTITLDVARSTNAVRLICRTPLSLLGGVRTVLKLRGYDGVEYSPYTVLSIPNPATPIADVPSVMPKGEVVLRTFGPSAEVQFNTEEILTYPLVVKDASGEQTLRSWNLTSYSTIVSPPKTQGIWTMNISDRLQKSTPVFFAPGGKAATVRGENYELIIDDGSLYRDTFIWPDSLPAYKARTLYPIGSLLQLGPRGTALNKNAIIQFRYPANTALPERLSIYRWSRTAQRWESQPSVINKNTHTVSTKVSYLDLFALLYDNVAPTIKNIFPKRDSSTSNNTPKLAALVSDAGMDVDDEKITFYVDGVPYPAEYDPDRNLATLQLEQPLVKGYHRFSVVAYDWGGNKTVSPRVTFRVR